VTVAEVVTVPVQVGKTVDACLQGTLLSREHVRMFGGLGGPGAHAHACF